MMAWRRLARDAAAQLRRGASPPFVPARGFSSPACSSSSSFRPRVTSPTRQFLARCSSPALRAPAAEVGPSLAARVALAVRPQLSGVNLLKGLATATVLTMTLHRETAAAAAAQARPSQPSGPPSEVLKNELSAMWPLVRKLQLPVGLMFLILSGWQNPIGLVINVLLLIYCSRPSRYSIYLFLQELHHREMHQNHAVRQEEFFMLYSAVHLHLFNSIKCVQTRKVDVEDYKFFSIGTVGLADGRVLHLIGMLGSWWIHRVSYAK